MPLWAVDVCLDSVAVAACTRHVPPSAAGVCLDSVAVAACTRHVTPWAAGVCLDCGCSSMHLHYWGGCSILHQPALLVYWLLNNYCFFYCIKLKHILNAVQGADNHKTWFKGLSLLMEHAELCYLSPLCYSD